MNTLKHSALLLSLIGCFYNVTTHAAIITPSSISIDSPVAFGDGSRLINGSGLNTTGDVTNWTHGGSGIADFTFGVNHLPVPYGLELDFDLGGFYELSEIYIWNYSNTGFDFYLARDTKDIDISYSLDGIDFTSYSSVTLVGTGNVTGGLELTQAFDLSVTASHVRVTINGSYGTPGHGHEVGLGEVRFNGDSQVPEPQSLLLLAIGLAGFSFSRKN